LLLGCNIPPAVLAATIVLAPVQAKETEVFIGDSSVVRGVTPPDGALAYVAMTFRSCRADGLLLVQEGEANTFIWVSLTDGNLAVRWRLTDGPREQIDTVANLAGALAWRWL
jgi:hypothetical protein